MDVLRMRIWLAAGLALALAQVPAQATSGNGFEILGAMDSGGGSGGVLSFEGQGTATGDLAVRTVAYENKLTPGSILVKTAERRLYLILNEHEAMTYPIGVGRDGFRWKGVNRITRKAEWPTWRPPKVMIEREAARGHFVPDFMPGGEQNPLGARALYIGDTEYRIHGTTQPWSIGKAVSSGCIRMLNEQVIDLYERVAVGAQVIVE